MRNNWWKYLAIALIFYNLIGGLLLDVPRIAIVNESIRNLYYHVPMWFSMVILFLVSVVYSIRFLSKNKLEDDIQALGFSTVGLVFGLIGLVTGMLWANYTWGKFWHGDVKQNMSAICILIYLAWFVLRSSIDDPYLKARVSAVYNIFAFGAMIALLFVLPRYTASLHPGNGGNPGFNMYDLDSRMRAVFYPSIIGWTLMGVWMATLQVRKDKIVLSLKQKL